MGLARRGARCEGSAWIYAVRERAAWREIYTLARLATHVPDNIVKSWASSCLPCETVARTREQVHLLRDGRGLKRLDASPVPRDARCVWFRASALSSLVMM